MQNMLIYYSNKIERGDFINKGKFIVFEGIDGSGKSTQAKLLTDKLEQKGINVYKTFEPTTSSIGSLIRLYLAGELKCDKSVLASLFASDRLDHFLSKNGIMNKVENGISVICDRNYLSNIAYQYDEDEDFALKMNYKVREMLKPDIHIFIDVEPKLALERILNVRKNIDIFENEQSLIQIKANYLKCFEKLKDEENIIIIDGNKPQEQVLQDIYDKISYLFFA